MITWSELLWVMLSCYIQDGGRSMIFHDHFCCCITTELCWACRGLTVSQIISSLNWNLGRNQIKNIIKSFLFCTINVCSSLSYEFPAVRIVDILKPFLPDGARCLELFARCLHPGWTSWGNEVIIRFSRFSMDHFILLGYQLPDILDLLDIRWNTLLFIITLQRLKLQLSIYNM